MGNNVRSYNLHELDGEMVLNHFFLEDKDNKKQPVFHFANEYIFYQSILSTESYTENALFYQIRDILGERSSNHNDKETEKDSSSKSVVKFMYNDDVLSKHVLYLNFGNLYLKEENLELSSGYKSDLSEDKWSDANVDQKAYRLFKDGFSVVYEGKETITYIPFDKSSSMTRKSRILFIDKSLFDELNNRIQLGFTFDGVSTCLSKFYAYRGLNLTNGTRIPRGLLKLNESTVVVIQDDNSKLVLKNVYTAKKKDSTASWSEWTGYTEAKVTKKKYTRFDGEGFISMEFAAIINEELRKKGVIKNPKDKATSFQIRLPFMKGMLHSMDFRDFIDKECYKNGADSEYLESLYIEDIFGIERPLKDVQIIMTQSMFKGYSWLKTPLFKEKNGISADTDIMKLFFERVDENRHALYIANTDCNLSRNCVFEKTYPSPRAYIQDLDYKMCQGNLTKMNYQFLHTLCLEQVQFEKLIKNHSEQSRNLLNDENKRNGRLLGAGYSIQDGSENDDENTYKAQATTWQYALSLNKNFINHPKIKGELREIQKSLIKDIGLGRLEVEGSLFFLSHDLLALMIHIMKQLKYKDITKCSSDCKNDKNKNENIFKSAIDALTNMCLKKEEFYTADLAALESSDPSVKELDGYYSLLRSPHLSRNEQCMLKAYNLAKPNKDEEKDIYKTYFGHLLGVVMISYHSDAAIAMAGADFDGDLVKVIVDPIINKAVKDHVYTTKKDKLIRELPVVDIPDTKSGNGDKVVSANIDYETVRNTFSSRVGAISNYAIKCGRKHYFEEKIVGLSECEITEPPLCTILTGLEIDAAKTGVHPVLPDMLQKTQLREDYFIVRKKGVENFKRMKKREVYSYRVKETTVKDPDRIEYNLCRSGGSYNSLFKAENTFEKAENRSNIDYLPYAFLQEWKKELENDSKNKTGHKNNKKESEPLFKFEIRGWKKELERDLKDSVWTLMDAYEKIKIVSTRYNKFRDSLYNSNYYGRVLTIAQIQYGKLDDETIGSYYAKILTAFDKESEISRSVRISDAIERLKAVNWAFAGSFEEDKESKNTKRRSVLYQILELEEGQSVLDDEVQSFLCNFSHKGYNLLYFILMDLLVYCEKEDILQNHMMKEYHSELVHLDSATGKKYLDSFYEIFQNAIIKKKIKSVWMKEISKKCNEYLEELFQNHGGVQEAVKYVYAKNASGEFFWDILSTEAIGSQILQNSDCTTGKTEDTNSNAG